MGQLPQVSSSQWVTVACVCSKFLYGFPTEHFGIGNQAVEGGFRRNIRDEAHKGLKLTAQCGVWIASLYLNFTPQNL
jgi:hypothetical protein